MVNISIMKTKNNLNNDQSGIASMLIVILIMTLLTLIVVSMTQNSNREQRQALDRQLNSQALYAAESGIADAKDYVVENPVTAPPKKTDCKPTADAGAGEYFKGKSPQVGIPDLKAVYTCVLYNRQPEILTDDDVGTDLPLIMPIEDANGGTIIKSLTITWEKSGGGDDFSGCLNSSQTKLLPQQMPANCQAGMFRVELLNPAQPTTRKDFLNNMFLAYFKPTTNGSANVQYSNGIGAGQGVLVNGRCVQGGACEVKIDNINKTKLYLNLRSLYMSNKLTSIKGVATSPGGVDSSIEFKNAQMSVDSTGRANDILKRISVTVPIAGSGGNLVSPFGIQTSDSLCKLLQLRPGKPSPVTDDCPPTP